MTMFVGQVRLSVQDEVRLRNSAKAAQRIEDRWSAYIGKVIDGCAKADADRITAGSEVQGPDFGFLLVEHYFDVQIRALTLAERETELDKRIRMAKRPRTLAEVMRLYDLWRKGLYKPKGILKQAQMMKDQYIAAVQKAWKRYSEDFREGGEQTQEEIRDRIVKSAQTTKARAKTIVRTETTRYYNQARRAYYDTAQDVTHYLFMAVRDKATTPWCTPGKVNGKRGRHGLVYAKDDPLLKKETPPCFSGETPILTASGWKRIDTVIAGEYVLTHEMRWRRVEEVHREDKRSVELFQIGFGMATSNHPYYERGAGFVEAELFRPEEGIRASSLNLRQVLKAGLDALVQKRPKVLLYTLSHYLTGSYSEERESHELERWQEEVKARLHRRAMSGSSCGEPAGLRFRASVDHGETARQEAEEVGGGPSHKLQQDGQPTGKSPLDDSELSCGFAQKRRWLEPSEVVYNLEVEEDKTYFAGGFLVHNCHWNCRSELLPLTPLNPTHRRLIEDASLARRHHVCTPLPPGWSK